MGQKSHVFIGLVDLLRQMHSSPASQSFGSFTVLWAVWIDSWPKKTELEIRHNT